MKKLATQLILVAITSTYCFAQNSPKLRRIEGKGNDGLVLDFAANMYDSILASPTSLYNYPLYDNNKGPVYVDVYNPSLTPSGDYQIIFNGELDTAKWKLVHLPTNTTVLGDTVIGINYTQDIPQWGIKIRTNPTDDPGGTLYTYTGYLQATMSFADNTKPWLTGVADEDGVSDMNWIRSGNYINSVNPQYDDYTSGIDYYEEYENVLGGTWTPYRLCAYTRINTGIAYRGGPAWSNNISLSQNKIANVASVDVIITDDQSKWTRCPVLEMQEDTILAIGNAPKLHMRASLSVDKNGLNSTQSGYNAAEGDLNGITGMGWFPGYAVNLETGERLNMAFGEDSWLPSENGADIKWNPTSTSHNQLGPNPVFGGKHYIYVFGYNRDANFPATDAYLPNMPSDIRRYDEGKIMHDLLQAAAVAAPASASDKYKRSVFKDAMWVNIPLLSAGYSLLETEVKIRLRVSKKYRRMLINNINNSNPMYIFNTGSLVGINEKSNETTFINLFPNPAKNTISIDYKSLSKNYMIKIYDATGRLVKNNEHNSSGTTTINIEDLNAGIYLVNVSDGKESITNHFVKQ